MIRDLSESIGDLLRASAPFAAVDILFERPISQFEPERTTVDVFLYDIRENMELRSTEALIGREKGKAKIHPPPLRVACSYIVTAWPVGGTEHALQEHRLLSHVLQLLSHYPTLPTEFLRGSLKDQTPPLPMIT